MSKVIAIKNNVSQKKKSIFKKQKLSRLEVQERDKLLKMEQLKREITLGELSVKCSRKAWTDMIMNVKLPLIKEGLEVALHTFNRALDVKDFSISFLLDTLDKAEEQYRMNERSHIEQIDRFMESYRTRLQKEEARYQKNLQEMLNSAEMEIQKINDEHNKEEWFLQTVILTMEHRLNQHLNNTKTDALAKLNEQNQKYECGNIAPTILKEKIRKLRNDLQNDINDYLFSKIRRDFEEIEKKDEEDKRIIQYQTSRTLTLFEGIRKVKGQIANLQSTVKEISEKEIVQNASLADYKTVKDIFVEDENIDKNQLKIMIKEYNYTIQHLEQFLKKGETVLSLVQMCGTYEAEEETINLLTAAIQFEELNEHSSSIANCDKDQVIAKITNELKNFWKRVGIAEMKKRDLLLKRTKLQEESNTLKQSLKKCMSKYVNNCSIANSCESIILRDGTPIMI